MNDLKNNCIIFVCMGNTCRSPMAEALLKSELKRLHVDGVDVSSAGLKGGGKPMNMYTAKTLLNRGLELNNFSSKLISESTFSALAVIAMTQEICEELKKIRQFGLDAGKLKEKKDNIFSFRELVGYDIPDPYGLGEREYARAFSQIEGGMAAIIERFATVKPEKTVQPIGTETTVETPVLTAEKQKTPRKKRTTTATKTATKTTTKTAKTATKKAATKKTATKTAAKKSAGTASSKISAQAATPKKTPVKKATKTKKAVKTPKENNKS